MESSVTAKREPMYPGWLRRPVTNQLNVERPFLCSTEGPFLCPDLPTPGRCSEHFQENILWRVSGARAGAAILGIGRTSLYRILKEHPATKELQETT